MFIKTKEDLLKQFNIMQENMVKYPERYSENDLLDNLIYLNKHSIKEIINNCINKKCPNYSTVEYKGKELHVCYDNWSNVNSAGWHVIYFETIDLCVETKISLKQKEIVI